MPSIQVPQSVVRCGIAVQDITPPVGIYCRMWGAARHDRAASVHRPLRATALVLSPHAEGDDDELVLLALDHCLLGAAEMNALLDSIHEDTGVLRENVLILFSHTHAAGLMSFDRAALAGGELIEPYLRRLASSASKAIRQARSDFQAASIVYGTGRCGLAVQRDFRDGESEQYVCGYNPDGFADDTMVVARITAEDGTILGTVVNYACHPTTLAWENEAISPDFPGAMRDLIEEATGAPCVFIQGASGDLAPKEQYVGDPEVADRNGRQLGYAAMSTISGLPPAGTQFVYAGPVVSGATLGVWKYEQVADKERLDVTSQWRLRRSQIMLAYREDRPDQRQTHHELGRWVKEETAASEAGEPERASQCRAMAERCRRLIRVLEQLPAGDQFPMPATILQLGDAFWIAVEAEHYQQLQTELRRRFPDRPIIVATLANGSRPRYLPPANLYGVGIYQESIALLAPGSLENLIATIGAEIEQLLTIA